MHSEKSAISLSWNKCHTNQGSLVIVSGQEFRFDPCISSVTTSIMITSSNSSVKRSGMPNQLLGVQWHTMAISGLSRVRTERLGSPRNTSVAKAPNFPHGTATSPSPFRRGRHQKRTNPCGHPIPCLGPAPGTCRPLFPVLFPDW